MLRSARLSTVALFPLLLFTAQSALHGQALMVGPTSVEFRAQAGSTAPQQQSVLVLGNQTTSAIVSISVTSTSWLTTPEPTVSIPKRITLIANPTGLIPGTYTATVTIQNVSTPPVLLPVTLVVSPSSQVAVSKSALQFIYHTISGKGTSLSDTTGAFLNTSSDQIVVTSTGNPIPYTASVSTSDGANWLVAAPTTGATPDALVVRISPSGLPAGSYSGTITLQSSAGGTPVSVSVQLVVSASPYLAPSQAAINLTAYSGTVAPVTQSLVLNSSGIVPYVVLVNTGGAWLNVTPSSGNAPTTLTVSANAGLLPPAPTLVLSSSAPPLPPIRTSSCPSL